MKAVRCFYLSVPLAFLLAPNVLCAETDPNIPSAVLQSWSYFVGDWEIEGEVGDRTAIGKASFEWADGRHCYLGQQVWTIGANQNRIHLTLLGGWDAKQQETVEQGFSSGGGIGTVRFKTDLKDGDAKVTSGKIVGFESRGGRWAGEVKLERTDANEYTLKTFVEGQLRHRLTYRRVTAPE